MRILVISNTTRLTRRSFQAVTTVALVLFAGCARPTPPVDENLVIISFDTLRADHLGAYGNTRWGKSPSPHVDALAAEGVLFETAYAPRGQTHPSLAAMLTGKYPITTGLRENLFPLPEEHLTLFQHLQEAGYQTGVFIANIEVEHSKEEWVARGADVAADGFAGRRQQEARNMSRFQRTWDDRVEQAALSFLDEVDTSRPFALWAHFYDLHRPYNPPPAQLHRYGMALDIPETLRAPGDGSDRALTLHLAGITLGDRDVPDAELTRILGLYDGTLKATDKRLGRILNKLDAIGETDSSLIIFTADHGEELFDHNRYSYHGASIYDGTVRIPLIVKGPGLARGLGVSALVQNIDIAPTVLDLLGLAGDTDMEGQSLAGLLRAEATNPPAPYAFIEWQDFIYAVTDGRYKLIWNPEHVWPRKQPYSRKRLAPPGAGFRIDCIEAYDLTHDPGEQVNLLSGFNFARLDQGTGEGLPRELVPLYAALREWLADPAHQRGLAADVHDAEAIERLQQLGYIATGGGSVSRGDSVKKEPCLRASRSPAAASPPLSGKGHNR